MDILPGTPRLFRQEIRRLELYVTIFGEQYLAAGMNIITRDPQNPAADIRADVAEDADPQSLVQYLIEHMRFLVSFTMFSNTD